jgi:hypothetical protein
MIVSLKLTVTRGVKGFCEGKLQVIEIRGN